MVVPPNGWFISWNIPSINGWFGGTPSQFRKPHFPPWNCLGIYTSYTIIYIIYWNTRQFQSFSSLKLPCIRANAPIFGHSLGHSILRQPDTDPIPSTDCMNEQSSKAKMEWTWRRWVKQCHEPSPSPHHFFMLLFSTIPSHGWFVILF
jgi:hypothetical protein